MPEQVILVAFTVPVESRPAAHDHLVRALVDARLIQGGSVEDWWVAEDDRTDGSDNDSAVFVPGSGARVGRAGSDGWPRKVTSPQEVTAPQEVTGGARSEGRLVKLATRVAERLVLWAADHSRTDRTDDGLRGVLQAVMPVTKYHRS